MIKLLPFSSGSLQGEVLADLEIGSNGLVIVHFCWNAEWPLRGCESISSENPAQRRHELWKTTCFEAFVKPLGQQNYWEINLSPQNQWNVYEFDDYRNPTPPHEAKGWSLVDMKTLPGELVARIKSDLSSKQNLRVGLTCVLENKTGEKSYWALKHGLTQPDFHDQSCFLLERRFL
jgi:hypothetical protein